MNSNLQVFLSNQTEALYLQLKERLFSKPSNPFAKRLVIVPSPAMKGWLTQRLADDLGIAAGIQIVFLEPGIRWLRQNLSEKDEDPFVLPERMELGLQIQNEIQQLLSEPKEELWSPLRSYLFEGKKPYLTAKSERRLAVLSDQLAGLFHQYEKYGKKMLLEWQKGQFKDWQQALWRRVVGRTEPAMIPWQSGNAAVHVFAISYLTRQQHQWLCGLAEKISVSYYLLSPCEVYWSDLLSDRENAKLIRCWEEQGMSDESLLEATELLFDRNPLLANWGKLGRLMAAQIEESEVQTDEAYVVDEEESALLQALQMDLLLLRDRKHLPEKIAYANDGSIQLHVATSKTREVQALYQTLLSIIDKHSGDDDPVRPRDIVVMAPNIMDYEPLIRSVFQSADSLLDCQIMDLNVLDQNPLIKGFFHLLDLAASRWDHVSVLALFQCKAFQSRLNLSQGEVDKLSRWVKDADIRWGIDAKHRSETLARNHCNHPMLDASEAGTWRFGINRLLLGMAMILPSDESDRPNFSLRPLKEIGSTEQELLGKWARVMEALQEDLRPLSDGARKTLSEWSEYLIVLFQRYFSKEALTEEELRQADDLENILRFSGVQEPLRDAEFGFTTIACHLKNALEQNTFCFREKHLQTVRFCSMLPMRAVPAKVVVLMGMSEDLYPRQETRLSLNQLYHHSGVDPFPSSPDFDRYLFLEAVLSARQTLVLSYHRTDQKKGYLEEASLLISELFSYLDRRYEVAGGLPSTECAVIHPFYPFDRSYFQKGAKARSYSYSDFKAAQSLYGTQAKEMHRFIPAFTREHSGKNFQTHVSIKHLKEMAKNPLRAYFTQNLGIYLREETQHPVEEKRMFSYFDRYRIKKDIWKNDPQIVWQSREAEGLLPVGPFKEAAIEDVLEQKEEWESAMLRFSVQPADVFKILLTENVQKPVWQDGVLEIPPVEVEVHGESVRLIGMLEDCTPEGIFFSIEGKKNDIPQVFPLYLVWCRVIEEYGFPYKKDLLCVKSGKRKEPFFEAALPLLRTYLEYYQTALENASPLIPEWIDSFVGGDPCSLQKTIAQSVSPAQKFFFNLEVKWLCREEEAFESEDMHGQWSDTAKTLYEQVFEKWCGRGK
jgi:exodeoxyribonuclease V gamma subunit